MDGRMSPFPIPTFYAIEMWKHRWKISSTPQGGHMHLRDFMKHLPHWKEKHRRYSTANDILSKNKFMVAVLPQLLHWILTWSFWSTCSLHAHTWPPLNEQEVMEFKVTKKCTAILCSIIRGTCETVLKQKSNQPMLCKWIRIICPRLPLYKRTLHQPPLHERLSLVRFFLFSTSRTYCQKTGSNTWNRHRISICAVPLDCCQCHYT